MFIDHDFKAIDGRACYDFEGRCYDHGWEFWTENGYCVNGYIKHPWTEEIWTSYVFMEHSQLTFDNLFQAV